MKKKKEIAKTIDVDNKWGPADASSNLRAKTNPFFPSYFFKVPVAVLKSFRKRRNGKVANCVAQG